MNHEIKKYNLPCTIIITGKHEGEFLCTFYSNYVPEGQCRAKWENVLVSLDNLTKIADTTLTQELVDKGIQGYAKGLYHINDNIVTRVELISIGSKKYDERCHQNKINQTFGHDWAERWARDCEHS